MIELRDAARDEARDLGVAVELDEVCLIGGSEAAQDQAIGLEKDVSGQSVTPYFAFSSSVQSSRIVRPYSSPSAL